ncbi:MAG: lipid II:glycine glycyltransferase FemX [Treponemataceae bacterium]|nr:MAG: lipid II:glycine glycyltransferase FemX [Treponemataceae bacterium]
MTLAQISQDDACAVFPDDSRFLQSPFWAIFKSRHGWKALFFRVTKNGCVSYCTVLIRRIARIFSLAYIPLYCEKPDAEFATALKKYLSHNTICIRFDLSAVWTDYAQCVAEKKLLLQKPFTAAPAIQPPDTVILDLHKSAETLLGEMKNKWSYNIRLAEKKGVSICAQNDAAGIDIFYNLYLETAKRDKIAIHSKKYYQALVDMSCAQYTICVYVARHEDDILAAIITLFCKREAVYLYGASSNVKRNFMATYLLQWHAIQDAKNYGSALYDFYGCPPFEDETHPMAGLFRFKTGFGGTLIHRAGCVDFPASPFFALYRCAEKLRNFWYKRVKKR